MDSEEFSMTASQGRSIKKKEKKRKKQGGAKGTPAAQPPPIRPTSNPDSMAERKESTASEETPKPEHDATLDQVGESSIAEDIIAATAAAAAAAPMDDTNSQTSESSHTSTYFSDEKLRWAYAQLERCLERRGDPPAWLLQLVMPETHHEQDRFEQETKEAVICDIPSPNGFGRCAVPGKTANRLIMYEQQTARRLRGNDSVPKRKPRPNSR